LVPLAPLEAGPFSQLGAVAPNLPLTVIVRGPLLCRLRLLSLEFPRQANLASLAVRRESYLWHRGAARSHRALADRLHFVVSHDGERQTGAEPDRHGGSAAGEHPTAVAPATAMASRR
jgi:hypothetical protein